MVPDYQALKIESVWKKQARLENDYSRELEEARSRRIEAREERGKQRERIIERMMERSSTPRYGRSSGLSSTNDFDAPVISLKEHIRELFAPEHDSDGEFSAPKMWHSRYEDF